MKRFVMGLAALGFGLGLSAASAAECGNGPIAPEVPGGFSTQEEKDSVKGEVLGFIKNSNEYLACLEAEERGLGDEITDDVKADITARYNNNIEAQEAVAAKYNDAAKAFNG